MDKKEHIVSSAQSLFAQFGLKKVTMDEIAREASVSKATLYKYYGNKSEVFNEVVHREASQLLNLIENAIDAESDSVRRLRAHLRTRLEKVGEFVNFYRVTQDSWGDYWPYIAGVRQDFLDREQALVEKILRQGTQCGELEIKNIRMAALALVLALASVEYQWSLGKKGISLTQMVDLMIEMMVNGIRKR